MFKIWGGHRRQLQKIFEQYAGALILYAKALVPDHQAAEDIVQDIFLGLLSTATVPEKPKNYLLRAVKNRAVNHRRQAAVAALGSDVAELFQRPLEQEEARQALSMAMLELPLQQREVVVLKIWNELSFREIAELLKLPANTVASRYRYGLERLRLTMANYYRE